MQIKRLQIMIIKCDPPPHVICSAIHAGEHAIGAHCVRRVAPASVRPVAVVAQRAPRARAVTAVPLAPIAAVTTMVVGAVLAALRAPVVLLALLAIPREGLDVAMALLAHWKTIEIALVGHLRATHCLVTLSLVYSSFLPQSSQWLPCLLLPWLP